MSKESALTSLNIPGAVDSSSVPSAAPDQLVASKDASSSEMETINSDPEITVTNSRIDFLARRNANVNFKLKDLLPDSVEELLGSVTFAPIRSGSSSSTNSGPVRTSARVIQKMRQDNRPSTPPPSNLSNGGPGGTGANCGSGVGSENTTKSDKVPNAPKTPTQSRNHIHGSGVVTSKRLWSNIERSLFFEALNEYGKDFDAIAQHINQKMRRKVLGTETSCKSREQVRHMYLQTFQKVSKYLRFSEGEWEQINLNIRGVYLEECVTDKYNVWIGKYNTIYFQRFNLICIFINIYFLNYFISYYNTFFLEVRVEIWLDDFTNSIMQQVVIATDRSFPQNSI